MNAIKRILMPTDFSSGAQQALRHAVVLADRLGAELHLLHVVTDPASDDGGMIGFPEMEELQDRMRREALRAQHSLLEPSHPGKLSMRSAVRRHTEAALAILDYAADHATDLIVIAPYGRRQGERFLIGSTAEKVVRLAPCDVLTSGLSGLYMPGMMRRILVPVDFSPSSALALERARILAEQAQAHLTVLHVAEATGFPGNHAGEVITRTRDIYAEAYKDLELFYRWTKGPDVPHQLQVLRGRPADRIATVADRHNIHLIVQGSHGRSGLDYARHGSVAELIVRHAPCPVLTVKVLTHASSPDGNGKKKRWNPDSRPKPVAVPVSNLNTEGVL